MDLEAKASLVRHLETQLPHALEECARHKAASQSMVAEVNRVQLANKELEDRNADLHRSLQRLQATMDEGAETTAQQLADSLRQSEMRTRDSESALQASREHIVQVQRELDEVLGESDAERRRLTGEIDALERRVREREAAVAAAETRAERAEQRMRQVESRAEGMHAEHADAAEELSALRAQIGSLRGDAAVQQRQFQTDRDRMEWTGNAVQEERESERQRAAVLMDQMDGMQRYIGHLEMQLGQRQDGHGRHGHHDNGYGGEARLGARSPSPETLRMQSPSPPPSLGAHGAFDHRQLVSAFEEKLRHQRAKYKSRIHRIDAECLTLREQVDELRIVADSASTKEQDLRVLCNELRTELAECHEQVDDKANDAERLNGELARLRRQLEAFDGRPSAEVHARVVEQLARAETRLAAREAECDELRSDVARSDANLRQATDRLAVTSRDLESTQADVADAQAKMERFKARMRQLETELEAKGESPAATGTPTSGRAPGRVSRMVHENEEDLRSMASRLEHMRSPAAGSGSPAAHASPAAAPSSSVHSPAAFSSPLSYSVSTVRRKDPSTVRLAEDLIRVTEERDELCRTVRQLASENQIGRAHV